MVPTNIKALNEFQIQKINCGKFHSLFLSAFGQVLSCGMNNFGQLGTGCKSNYFTPTLIENLSDVAEISSWHYSAAITKRNELYVWGTGIFGESLKPKKITQCDGLFKKIAVGGSFSVLVDNQNKGYLWGNSGNSYGMTSGLPAPISTLESKEVT
jgi:X-linked retinitis pigmentosa GTPase regulator